MISKHGSLWPQIHNALHCKYQIIDWIDVLDEQVDIYPQKLYHRLMLWKNASLAHNQRIVIYHRDTDYYYDKASTGFFLKNLYRVFNYLNIPSNFIIILHQAHDLAKESQNIAKKFNLTPALTVYCPYQWCPIPQDVLPIDLNFDRIQKPFVCLNGVPRNHRMYTLSVLKELDMFTAGMSSLWGKSTAIVDHTANTNARINTDVPNDLPLCLTANYSRINDDLVYTKKQRDTMIKWFDSLSSHCSPLIDGMPNQNQSRYQPNFLQIALWNIITESVGEYPYAYFTEKTWKAILTKRPFVLLGGFASLKQLKSMGFRTFDSWIDESYDTQEHFATRCDMALAQIKPYCSLHSDQLKCIAAEMEEVLTYNFNHYINEFGGSMVENLIHCQL